MIKKTIFTYWLKQIDKEYTYEKLQTDKILLSQFEKKYEKFKIRTIFFLLFLFSFIYFLFLKAELYESRTSLIVRDLSTPAKTQNLGLNILGVGSSSALKDSKVVEEYILSLDMFLLLDEEFHLINHYRSDNIDFIERLSSNSTLENALAFYRTRVKTTYDEVSGIIHLSYAHTNKYKAKEIVEFIIKNVEFELNEFNRRKAKKQLKFIQQEYLKNKKNMEKSSAILEKYQNDNLLLDPTAEASSSSGIISNLESTLTQKHIEYKSKSSYLNPNNYELMALKSEIKEITSALEKAKQGLTGKDNNRLNKILFEYDKLKMQLEFDTEVYKNSLIQLETAKIDALKEAKTLSVVSRPNLPDGYTYPNKPKTFLTLIIVIFLVYGISSMLLSIIKDHKE